LGLRNSGCDRWIIGRSADILFFSHTLALHRPKSGAATNIPKATDNTIRMRTSPSLESFIGGPENINSPESINI
jgi:hypothetical protein